MTFSIKDRNIAIVVDTFYPAKTSAAIQILDLSVALDSIGLNVTVFVPNPDIEKNTEIFKTKNINVFLKSVSLLLSCS